MAFKPANSGGGGNGGSGDREYTANLPVPKSGSRKARVSLIVDLGIQNREDFEDPKTKEMKPQKPAHQVAAFADLVNDVVDYGGNIGEQQYRLPLNNIFKGVIEGINFNTVPPTDAEGKRIEGKPWGLHPRNKLTILAKAVGKEEITVEGKHPESLDISLLLNEPFMAQVEVKETPHKEGKKDKDGKPIVYKNVNYRGAAPIPTVENEETGEEEPMKVAALRQKPLCITFDDAKEADIQFIRPSIIKIITSSKPTTTLARRCRKPSKPTRPRMVRLMITATRTATVTQRLRSRLKNPLASPQRSRRPSPRPSLSKSAMTTTRMCPSKIGMLH
jgi:hypothetical protein